MSLALLTAVCSAAPLDPEFENPEAGRLASELVRFCNSTDSDKLAYCEGYIRGAAHLWKIQWACASAAREDQLFCAGVNDARNSLQEALSTCADCDQPDGLRRFRDELRSAGDICATDESHDENYCAGYNTWIEFAVANLMPFQPIEAGQSAEDAGFSHAVGDVFLHLWASSEFGNFAPCLAVEVRTEQMRKVFTEFMRDNPAQQTGSTALIALEKALFYGLCPGPELGLRPHMEHCTTFDYDNGKLLTRNVCEEVVFVRFMEEEKGVFERQLAPGEAFVTGRVRGQEGGWWMFTTCPPGHVSSPALSEENNDAIQASRYSCVRK